MGPPLSETLFCDRCLVVQSMVPASVKKLHVSNSCFVATSLLKLTHLRVEHDECFKIDDITACANLESIRLNYCRNVSNIQSLQCLASLRSLRLRSFMSFAGLEMLTQLTSLEINMDYVEMW
jgi:hypothetical protein